jgi:hypothetical protein
MTIRHEIAKIIARGRGGDSWNATLDDDEASVLILDKIKSSVPALEWVEKDKGLSQPDFHAAPYHLCYRSSTKTYGVFCLTMLIGAGETLDDAKAIAQQWDTYLKTGWML